MAKIRLPPILRPFVGGVRETEIPARNLREALLTLALRNPEVGPYLFDDEGLLSRYV